MASKSGNNAAGTSAGQVYVSLRADTTQLEADLKKAQGQVGQFAGGGALGGATVQGAREAAQANDMLVESTKKAAATVRGDAAYLAREVRRDYRQMGAELKDQMGDVTAFSGKGLADALFGIDKDKIAVGRSVQSLADLESKYQSGQISQALYTEESRKHTAVIDNMTKKYSGATGTLRGFGATMVSSLGSSLLIGAGIGLATTALQTLLEAGSYMIEKLLNPTKATAAAFNDLSAAIKSVGGMENFAALVSGDTTLINLAKQAELATTMAKSSDTLAKLFGAGSSSGATGAGAIESVLKSGEEAARAAAQKPYQNFFGLMDWNAIGPDGERKIKESAKNLGGQAIQWLEEEIAKGVSPYDALGTVAGRRYRELMAPSAAGGAAVMPPSISYEAASLLRQRALLTGQELPFGALAAPSRQEALQTRIAELQTQQAALNNAGAYAAIGRSLQDARLNVARSSVAGANDTIFDVAIRRSEALEALRRSREDAARQRTALALQSKIADKSERLEKLNKLDAIEERLTQIRDQFGTAFETPTTPITTQEKDQVASAIRTIYDYATARGLRMIPK